MHAASRGDVPGSPRRLWVTFGTPRPPEGTHRAFLLPTSDGDLTDVMIHGCGVTGFDADDCWRRIKDDVFPDQVLPAVRDACLDVDVSTLDPDWVLPRVGDPAALGVWFPPRNTTPVS